MAPGQQSFDYVRDLVYRRSGIVIADGKEYLVDMRLAPLVQREGLASLEALTAKLRADEGSTLSRDVVEAMTNNETYFFRDRHPFELLKKKVVPELLQARASTRTLRIWCGASSTGQEPCSIAMLLRENFPQLEDWNVRITATDLNGPVLDRAQAGLYRQIDVDRGLPPAMLRKYFKRTGANWIIDADLRRTIAYERLNLLDPWPFAVAQDIVFIRNVLMYFDVPTKRAVFAKLRATMQPDGALFLGGSETPLNLDDRFVPERSDAGTFYRLRPVELASATPERRAGFAR